MSTPFKHGETVNVNEPRKQQPSRSLVDIFSGINERRFCKGRSTTNNSEL